MKRRDFLASSAAAAGMLAAGPAFSQDKFPNRPITLIVPWPAGSGVDLWHRALGEAAGRILGQPITVDNRTGGTGTSGPAAMAANAKPDGYTISQIPVTVFRFPFIQKATYDPLKDFSYIIHLSGYTFGVVVRADSPFKTFQDLIAFARANPNKMTYATPGAGSSLHLGMEQIALQAGVKFTHVPFKGGPEGWAALEGGHVMADADATGWAPLVDSGKFRLLVLWTADRNPRWPTVPTLKETGFNFVIDSPFGFAGPKGMAPEVVKTLHDALKVAVDDPKVLELMKKYDYPKRYMGTDDYVKFVTQQVEIEKGLVEKLGLAKK
ncbi:MAG TPA: tripartite tricarboxylate transporter substrate binding protein [Hyphomicrobiaceae bacterium]|nr:tripartite tricarboxylate transporter substrate binding protein [Hyphomicrobiaceae bacterium]